MLDLNNDNVNSGSIGSNGSKGVLGNTKTKTRDAPSKRWCFTLNNYKKDDIEIIVDKLGSNKYVIGKEVGENKTPHLQGYIELESKKRFTYLKELLPGAHIEKAKGNRSDNIKYCEKDGDYVQNFREIIHYYEPVEKLKFLIDKMNAYKFPEGDRKIHCVIDEVGNLGKTEFARYCVMNFPDCIISSGKASDIKNQIVEYKKINDRCPKYVIFDIPRKSLGFVSYTGIEEVKNMLFYSGKYEGGMVNGNKPFVLLMMNDDPEFSAMSEDRWEIYRIEPDME